MKCRIAALLVAMSLQACATGPTYLGYSVSDMPFKADGGKTVHLPMTRAGSVPAENEEYKIEGAGFMVALKKGDAKESQLTWTFSFLSKKRADLDYVVVEQVTPSGALQGIVKDSLPVLKNGSWTGRAVPMAMTKDLVPWLYLDGDSTFLFKFTIKAKDQNPIVMYQPSLAYKASKALSLRVLEDRKGS